VTATTTPNRTCKRCGGRSEPWQRFPAVRPTLDSKSINVQIANYRVDFSRSADFERTHFALGQFQYEERWVAPTLNAFDARRPVGKAAKHHQNRVQRYRLLGLVGTLDVPGSAQTSGLAHNTQIPRRLLSNSTSRQKVRFRPRDFVLQNFRKPAHNCFAESKGK
jgi:hypothetical protein